MIGPTNEYEGICAEIAEQLRFLKELGVESINAGLPAVETHVEPEIAHSEFQTYVPDLNELTARTPQEHAPERAPARKDEILRSMRLTDFDNREREETLPRSSEKPTAEPVPEPRTEPAGENMFVDTTRGLAETNETLSEVHADIGRDCARCRLCEKRTQVVNSVGNPNAELMFIGEAPGADEDAQGEPFVGRAGQLLTKIIEAIDLKREDVFIGNINRCRPPDNRRPLADEAEVCKPFLLREIAIVRPKVIVVMGNTACQNLLDTKVGITRLRGKFLDYFGIKVMPTFHPAYLLRDPRKKREVWEDMKTVRSFLGGDPQTGL